MTVGTMAEGVATPRHTLSCPARGAPIVEIRKRNHRREGLDGREGLGWET
jgi:hypothetical protein